MPLDERVSAELASHYTPDVRSLLDIGCGDGHALFPALATAHPHALERLTLVEPASALLTSAMARAQAKQPALPVQALNEGLGAFAAKLQPDDTSHARAGRAGISHSDVPRPARRTDGRDEL